MFSDHKPLETHSKRHDKTLSRINEAFMKWNFEIKYKKGSEIPADFQSRNVVEAIKTSDEDLAELQMKDALCTAVRNFLDSNINPPKSKFFENWAKKIRHECFLDKNIL